MSGQKKRKSAMPSDETVERWKVRLADLQRRAGVFRKAGVMNTVWDMPIIQLESLIDGAKSPKDEGAKIDLEVDTDGK